MDVGPSLLTIAIIPTCTSVVLYQIFNNEKNKNKNNKRKQLIAGLIFGLIAIFATEFGVPYKGTIINARDAAPLCAGLIFGSQAGILAGLIGGIERWFCVYWNNATYTRLACSISTVLTGFISAYLRKFIFDDHLPDSLLTFYLSTVCETIHMMMIFFTNSYDARTAFEYVQICSVPMILTNSLAVFTAMIIIKAINNELSFGRVTLPHFSTQLQRIMILVTVAGIIATSSFTRIMQKRISNDDTYQLLENGLEDGYYELTNQVNSSLLQTTRYIRDDIGNNIDIDLKYIKADYDVMEINIIDKEGIIIRSSEDNYLGFDMRSGPQSNEFMCLLEGESEYIQNYRPTTNDENVYRKYAGIATDYGFMQVGFGGDNFEKQLNDALSGLANFRHIGNEGDMVVVDRFGKIISDSMGYVGHYIKDLGLELAEDELEAIIYEGTFDNIPVYYMHVKAASYIIIAWIPKTEADFSMNISSYLNIFTQIIIFGALFVIMYRMTKTAIVDNVDIISDSLQDISEGHLDTVVNVRTNKEFVALSDGINSTVDSLKTLIAQANERIDTELQYAREIQSSALPSNFPAFPDRDDFDIYALMQPARQVGGDFYDFYFINNDTLVFLVADVSGKGIPASLFMMRAKTIIKSYAEAGIACGDVFTNVNYQLCQGNDTDMFVTAWMGFLNTGTGKLTYVNDGHNPPLLKRKDGDYELLKCRPGFVLGGMEGIAYKEETLDLEPGDCLFLYTDGVVEATSVDTELYGEERLQDRLNEYKDETPEGICKNILKDVEYFFEGVPQFDDITEMSFKYLKKHD